jgi:hypothetical protein
MTAYVIEGTVGYKITHYCSDCKGHEERGHYWVTCLAENIKGAREEALTRIEMLILSGAGKIENLRWLDTPWQNKYVDPHGRCEWGQIFDIPEED